MLKSLSILNIALIDSATIDFENGLNILSGETGAGKSIILDSLGFILGDRADRTLIRQGEEKAVVKGIFDISQDNAIKTKLNDIGVEPEDELIIMREMTTEGKNVCRVNGEKITLGMLKTLTKGLVDIYAQHDSTILLDEDKHIGILDEYLGSATSDAKYRLEDAITRLNHIKSELTRLGSISDVYKKIDILEYEIKEISDANLVAGEEEELRTKAKMYANVESILEGLNGAYSILSGDDTDTNVLGGLGSAGRFLSDIAEYNSEIADLESEIESARDILSDVARSVMILAENTEYDPYDATRVDERLDTIKGLKRKYGNSIEEILEYLAKIEAELDDYSNVEERIASLENDLRSVAREVYAIASELSDIRKNGAKALEKALIANLCELGMKNVQFYVSFESLASSADDVERISSNGMDKVVFMMSANLGQQPRPLAKVVSGGELSRFMLALKNVYSHLTNVHTMVFDEIDSGISGSIAYVVAEKLSSISKDKQVLAVTHLPQLGAMADSHFLIEKRVVGDTTKTFITRLYDEDREREISRLMGGDNSELSLAHAREIMANASKYKQIR